MQFGDKDDLEYGVVPAGRFHEPLVDRSNHNSSVSQQQLEEHSSMYRRTAYRCLFFTALLALFFEFVKIVGT